LFPQVKTSAVPNAMPVRWKSNYRFLIRAARAAKSARQEAAAAVARRKAAAAINQKYRARDRGS
jgi:hypothetical protein